MRSVCRALHSCFCKTSSMPCEAMHCPYKSLRLRPGHLRLTPDVRIQRAINQESLLRHWKLLSTHEALRCHGLEHGSSGE